MLIGDFFPFSFSPLAYNESLAQDYVPIDKTEALKNGFEWREPNAKEFETTIQGSALPDLLESVSDDVTKEVIACESCKRAYRIIPTELQFYDVLDCRFLTSVTTADFWKDLHLSIHQNFGIVHV